jgi:flagellar hook-associated protein 1 FlgK
MSLSLTLNNALSSLRVNRESLNVLSQNIANANNPNYSRKVIDQAAVSLVGTGAGVTIDDISRKIDSYLQSAIRDQTSVAGRVDALSDFSDRLQIMLGNPSAGNDISSYVTSMFTALQSLAETPERSSSRLNVINVAQQVTTQMHNLVDGIQGLRFDADQEIKTSVSEVNIKIRELYNINQSIANAKGLNRPVSELLDKRDTAIRELSSHLDVNIFVRSNDTVRVYAKGGATLLDDSIYEIDYTPASSIEAFTKTDAQSAAINVYRLDANGSRTGSPTSIATAGNAETIRTQLQTGKIKALMDIRDDKMPQVLEQLDMLASRIRDSINAIHNIGSGYPGTRSLTGTRLVTGGSVLNWTGNTRLSLNDINGQPLPSAYADEESPMRPLNLDFSKLDAGLGDGNGYPNTQTIINEINSYFGIPRNRVKLGDLNNIQLTSTNQSLPASSFSFDFDLENISGKNAAFFVTGTTVRDQNGVDITSVTNTAPSFSLNNTGTYTTTAGSTTVTVAATGHGLQNGDYVFLPDATTSPGGLPNNLLGGYFKVSNVSGDSFDIEVSVVAPSSATVSDTGLTAIPQYAQSATGGSARTKGQGSFTADLSGNATSDYYDITVNVGVANEDGTLDTSTITYRVQSNEYNLMNKRYGAKTVTGSAEMIVPVQANRPYLTAKLVDANGQELQKINGQYVADEQGYLVLETSNSNSYFNIDSLDSSENGNPNASPFSIAGTNRGFSHYFELNNFFNSNIPTLTGDTVKGSAAGLEVSNRIARDPSQISTGRLVQIRRPADSSKPPYYSYERIAGDNSIMQRMAQLSTGLIAFDSAGGLSASQQTLNGYAGEILGFAGADANNMESNSKNAKVILDGFIERSSAISGVNLDEELANTVIYQNAYSASARIITVVDQLFKDLIGAIV